MRFALLALVVVALVAGVVADNQSSGDTGTGKAFLAANKAKAGVTETASGLQYEVMTRGTGSTKPTRQDTVRVHYKGTTIDGKEFDSSYSRGQPATFGVTQVIAGSALNDTAVHEHNASTFFSFLRINWTEVLQLMVPGDIYFVTIPSNLAYGARGAGGLIGPNAVLQFKIELLGIEGKDL